MNARRTMDRLALVAMCGLAIFVLRPCLLLAANGDTYSIRVGQRYDGENHTPVSRRFVQYRDTTGTTCYQGQAWCCKTSHDSVRLSHDHLDTEYNGDLTSTQKTRANNY